MKLIVCFKIVTCSFPFENNVNDCVKCLKSDAVVFLPSRIREVVLQPVIYLTRSNTSHKYWELAMKVLHQFHSIDPPVLEYIVKNISRSKKPTTSILHLLHRSPVSWAVDIKSKILFLVILAILLPYVYRVL